MNLRTYTAWAVSLTLFSVTLTLAAPIQLTVQPKGTNQVALTIGPVVQGGVYGVLARTNGPGGHWTVLGPFFGDTNKALSVNCELSGGMTVGTLDSYKFVAGNWEYSPYYNIPPLAKELIFRTDPSSYLDPNASLMGDGWANIQKFQNNMDPFVWYPPPGPQLNVRFYGGMNNDHNGSAVLTWQVLQGAVPDYFLIERANRTLRPAKDFKYDRPPPGARLADLGPTAHPD